MSQLLQYQQLAQKVLARGAELSFGKTWEGGTRLRESYGIQDTEQRNSHLLNSPYHLGKINISVPIPMMKNFRAGYELQYFGKRKTLNGSNTDCYVLFNLNDNLTVCIHGEDPFGDNLRYLQEKKLMASAYSTMNGFNEILNQIGNKPILIATDISNMMRREVVVNMIVKEGKVIFGVDIKAAQEKNLQLNSQLLRFANKIYQ